MILSYGLSDALKKAAFPIRLLLNELFCIFHKPPYSIRLSAFNVTLKPSDPMFSFHIFCFSKQGRLGPRELEAFQTYWGPLLCTMAARQSTSCNFTLPCISHSLLWEAGIQMRGTTWLFTEERAWERSVVFTTEALPTGFVSTQYLLIASNCLKLHHHTATQQRKKKPHTLQVPPRMLFSFSSSPQCCSRENMPALAPQPLNIYIWKWSLLSTFSTSLALMVWLFEKVARRCCAWIDLELHWCMFKLWAELVTKRYKSRTLV